MKILFAGCREEFERFLSAIAQGSCVVEGFKDDDQLVQDVRHVAEGCDWVVLGGHNKMGEKDLARLFGDAADVLVVTVADEAGERVMPHQCGVTMSESGALQLSCGLHRMSGMAGAYGDDSAPGSFVFEYRAACGRRR